MDWNNSTLDFVCIGQNNWSKVSFLFKIWFEYIKHEYVESIIFSMHAIANFK